MADDEKDKVEGEGLGNEDAPKEDPDAPDPGAKAASAKDAEEKPKPKPKRRSAAKKDDDAEVEEKPKPKRTRKKAQPKAEQSDDAADEAAADEPSADEVAEQAKPDEVDKPKRRPRRGAAEVSSSKPSASARRRSAEDGADGQVIVRAKARYVRTAPRKARLVVDHIRGKSVDEARAILIHTPRAASRDVLKLLDSAIANAENNHELVADELKIHQAFVDEGPTLKRYRPRALGRATRIRKRTSHMTILLTPKE